MIEIYKTKQVRAQLTEFQKDYFVAQCKQANSLYNSAVYEVRQQYFGSAKIKGWFNGDEYRMGHKSSKAKAQYVGAGGLADVFKSNNHYIALGGQCAQQVLMSVYEAFQSYDGLLDKAFAGELHFWPKLPKYRKSGGLYTLSYNPSAVGFDECTGKWRLPISRDIAAEVKELNGEIWIQGCEGVNPNNLSEIRVLPRNNEFYFEFVYKCEDIQTSLDQSKFISIDPGLNNALTVVSNIGRSFIVCGKCQKYWNHQYNRAVSQRKSGQPQDYWDEDLSQWTEQRNRQLRDFRNKSARFIINFCLENDIGTLLFGWNEGIKQHSNMGKVNNQNFVQVPLAKLKNRIKELCDEYGIRFIEGSESYTSKASFLDGDSIPEYGEKPKEWKPSGTRTKRGLYKTATGLKVNADANGSANIARKLNVTRKLGLDLSGLDRRLLTAPKRYDVFQKMSKSYRKRSEDRAILSPAVATA